MTENDSNNSPAPAIPDGLLLWYGGRKFTIRTDPEICAEWERSLGDEFYGAINIAKGEITISERGDFDFNLMTLLHEILHAIREFAGRSKSVGKVEDEIDMIANGLATVLRDPRNEELVTTLLAGTSWYKPA